MHASEQARPGAGPKRAALQGVVVVVAAAAGLIAQAPNNDLGYTDTPMLPGLAYRVHDPARPHPPVVTPAAPAGGPSSAAPSDALVLFSGQDLSHWTPARQPWRVENGYMEVAPNAGNLTSKESFGDVQLHVEWAAPAVVRGTSQNRGNSGVFLQGRYEIQVLDSFENPTYADGQAAAIYGQWPPLVNPARRPGEWQSYDIVFEAPRFNGSTLVAPAYVTVFFNGVLVHNRRELMGVTVHRALARYQPSPLEGPIVLQDHQQPVRYRNIWVRRLGGR
jgi:hypothetical protein